MWHEAKDNPIRRKRMAIPKKKFVRKEAFSESTFSDGYDSVANEDTA